jgi:hypothetical protein
VASVLWAHHRGSKARPEDPHDKLAGSAAAAVPGSGVQAEPPGRGKTDVLAFPVALGEAMIDSGDPVTHIRSTLTKVAEVNGVEGTGIIVLATALIVSVPGEGAVQTAVQHGLDHPRALHRLRRFGTHPGAGPARA